MREVAGLLLRLLGAKLTEVGEAWAPDPEEDRPELVVISGHDAQELYDAIFRADGTKTRVQAVCTPLNPCGKMGCVNVKREARN